MAIDYSPISKLEQKLGAPEKFFANLKNEGDWSFLIKLAALMDAALSSVIVEAIGRPEVAETVEAMSLSDGPTGKLRIGQRLGLLNKTHVSYLKQLQRLRNTCAHKVENVNFDLVKFVSSLEHGDFGTFVRSAVLVSEQDTVEADTIEYAKVNPRNLLWLGAMAVLLSLAYQGMTIAAEKETAALYESFFKSYGLKDSLASLQQNPPRTSDSGLLGDVRQTNALLRRP